jgi:hypothetical protein
MRKEKKGQMAFPKEKKKEKKRERLNASLSLLSFLVFHTKTTIYGDLTIQTQIRLP